MATLEYLELPDGSRLACNEDGTTGWYRRRRDGSFSLPHGWRWVRSGESVVPKRDDIRAVPEAVTTTNNNEPRLDEWGRRVRNR
jgi:hypothetical protein